MAHPSVSRPTRCQMLQEGSLVSNSRDDSSRGERHAKEKHGVSGAGRAPALISRVRPLHQNSAHQRHVEFRDVASKTMGQSASRSVAAAERIYQEH